MLALLVTLSVLLVLMAVIWIFRLPAGYQVVREANMQATPDVVFDTLKDFQSWPKWSPWLIHDDATELNYQGETGAIGSGYSWNSRKIGQGVITLEGLESPHQMDLKLAFIKPFKSVAQVQFEIKRMPDDTSDVVWRMQSQMPLFMRPFGWMVVRMIGLDFELGLGRMAAVFNPKAEHPRISFNGLVERQAQEVAVLPYSGALHGLSDFMQDAYPRLSASVGPYNDGVPLALYHRVNVRHETTICDAAIPVKRGFNNGAVKTAAAGRYYHVRLQGSYRFLPSAWNAAMGHVRMEKLKIDNKRAALEVYPLDPRTTHNSNEWVTDIYVPVR